MKVLERWDNTVDKATYYQVEVSDGMIVNVKRKWFSEFRNVPLTYVMDPHPKDIDEKAVLDAVKLEYSDDFQTYKFEYQAKGAFKPVQMDCYSKEQALYIAEAQWNDLKNAKYLVFRVATAGNKKIVKDWLV